ncbi:MAG: hypothetical protein MUP44_01245, partial [Anaerolineales bacterium]|nr:hypothetical protein [Anaerolineales bacterium]
MIGKYTSSLSDQKSDDLVRDWFTQLDRGLDARKEQEKRWEVNEAFEDMRQWDDGMGGLEAGQHDRPTINKIGSYNRNYRSSVAYRNPGVKYIPKNAAAWETIKLPVMGSDGVPKQDPQTGEVEVIEMTRAKARETLVNDIIKQPNFGQRDMISRVVKSGCLAYGSAMVGYTPTFETPLDKDTDDEMPVLEDGS